MTADDARKARRCDHFRSQGISTSQITSRCGTAHRWLTSRLGGKALTDQPVEGRSSLFSLSPINLLFSRLQTIEHTSGAEGGPEAESRSTPFVNTRQANSCDMGYRCEFSFGWSFELPPCRSSGQKRGLPPLMHPQTGMKRLGSDRSRLLRGGYCRRATPNRTARPCPQDCG